MDTNTVPLLTRSVIPVAISNPATLNIYLLPVINPLTLVQCDDTDGISNFNLTEKNNTITADFAVMTFTSLQHWWRYNK
jgi:hypothetical protein